MKDRDRVTVVNAYGDIVEGATAKDIRVGGGYSRNTLVDIRAPGYLRRRISPTREGVVMMTMNPETAIGPGMEEACRHNLWAAAAVTSACGKRLSDYFLRAVEQRQDRCYFSMVGGTEGAEILRAFDRTGAFRRVPAGLHDPHEEGFEIVGSWKTTRGAPDLQVTLWEKSVAWNDPGGHTFVAELDLDLRTGRGHVFEVARNHLTGGKTHPYLANQALSWTWGCVSFRLEAGT